MPHYRPFCILQSIGDIGHTDLPGIGIPNKDHQTLILPHHDTVIRERAYVAADRIDLNNLVSHVGSRSFACRGFIPFLDSLLADGGTV